MADYPDNLDDIIPGYEEVKPTGGMKVVSQGNKSGYVGTNSTSFRDFLLNPELMKAISDCGFEHPSEVQQETIPRALQGKDIICQGKSGMGKTAIFVISILQQIDPIPGEVSAVVIAPTRDLSFQICKEFNRFTKYMSDIKTYNLVGGVPRATQVQEIKELKPTIIVATPGRLLDLVKTKDLRFPKLRFFVVDECDKVFEKEDMRRDVKDVYKVMPQEKQVLLLTATMPDETKAICREFTRNAIEVFIDDKTKLTLHGIQQYYVRLAKEEMNQKLLDIMSRFQYNQMFIFVSSTERADILARLLENSGFPSTAFHSRLSQEERVAIFTKIQRFEIRTLICTDLLARGVDFERVNIVVNYDLPNNSDTYLHRVGRTGRFGTKGLAVSFVQDTPEHKAVLEEIQSRFKVTLDELPESVDASTYMNA